MPSLSNLFVTYDSRTLLRIETLKFCAEIIESNSTICFSVGKYRSTMFLLLEFLSSEIVKELTCLSVASIF